MREVILRYASEPDLASALASAAGTGRLPHSEAETVTGLVQVVFEQGGHRLAIFAQANGNAFEFTDELADLRFQVERFADEAGLLLDSADAAGHQAIGEEDASGVGDDGEKEDPDGNEDLSDDELAAVQSESQSPNPLVEELKRIKVLPVAQKLRLAEDGSLTQRNLLFRMYGKLVFESLLRNPRITEPEVAKLAKLGTLPPHLFQAICKRPDWLRSERIRNNLLVNPRTPAGIVQRIVAKLSKQELRPLLRRRDLPQPVQAAIKAQNAKLLR